MNVFFINRKVRGFFSVLVLSCCGLFLFFGTALADCSASFSWLPNAESNIIGYKIYYGQTKDGPYPNVVNVGNPAPVDGRINGTVIGLACEQKYYFVCVAVNDANVESDYSVEVPMVPGATEDTIPMSVPDFELRN